MISSSDKEHQELVNLRKENQALVRSLGQVNQQNLAQLEELQQNLNTVTKQNEEYRNYMTTERQSRLETKRAMAELQEQNQRNIAKVNQLSATLKEKDSKMKVLEKEKGDLKQAHDTLKTEKDEIVHQLEELKKKQQQDTLVHQKNVKKVELLKAVCFTCKGKGTSFIHRYLNGVAIIENVIHMFVMRNPQRSGFVIKAPVCITFYAGFININR